MKNKINILLIIILVFLSLSYLISLLSSNTDNKSYLVAGTGNPGEIILYEMVNSVLKQIKIINTGYKFVYSVRLGDIYNNKKQYYIVAGVSNSFFAEPYGCKVIAYDLEKFQQTVIDDVGDLRCKDLTIGDADNDGKNEILLGTHGQGIVRFYKWDGIVWIKEDLEKNFIAQIDEKEKTNHRVSNSELTCKDCVVQTAVHIVKIADVDNDGKNEIITTQSSPLELKNTDEISFVKVYRKKDNKWQSETIDRLTNREFRSITVGDIYNTGKNILLIGIGSPREEKGSIYAYEFKNNKWEKTIVYNEQEEKNMKGVAIGDIYNNGKKQILLATGFPNAKVIVLDWNGKYFDKKEVGKISSLFQEKDGEFNSMAAIIQRVHNSTNFIIAGMTTFPKEKIGWEGTDKGFLVKYSLINNNWKPEIIEKRNILGMDIHSKVWSKD